jgi:hypothetical protein
MLTRPPTREAIDGTDLTTAREFGFITAVHVHDSHTGAAPNDGDSPVCPLWTIQEAVRRPCRTVPVCRRRWAGGASTASASSANSGNSGIAAAGETSGSRKRIPYVASPRTGSPCTCSAGGWLNRTAFGGVSVMMSVLSRQWVTGPAQVVRCGGGEGARPARGERVIAFAESRWGSAYTAGPPEWCNVENVGGTIVCRPESRLRRRRAARAREAGGPTSTRPSARTARTAGSST